MATSMKDLVGDPLDEFAAKFTATFVRLGIPATMYVKTDVEGDTAVSRLVRLGPGEAPPKWDGEDPREELQGGKWRGEIGGVQFYGERCLMSQTSYTQPDSRLPGQSWHQSGYQEH